MFANCAFDVIVGYGLFKAFMTNSSQQVVRIGLTEQIRHLRMTTNACIGLILRLGNPCTHNVDLVDKFFAKIYNLN